MIGPVPRSPDGTYPIEQGATYRATLDIAAPPWIINEGVVSSRLNGAGFRVQSVRRLAPQRFEALGERTGPSGAFEAPERVTIVALERTA